MPGNPPLMAHTQRPFQTLQSRSWKHDLGDCDVRVYGLYGNLVKQMGAMDGVKVPFKAHFFFFENGSLSDFTHTVLLFTRIPPLLPGKNLQ